MKRLLELMMISGVTLLAVAANAQNLLGGDISNNPTPYIPQSGPSLSGRGAANVFSVNGEIRSYSGDSDPEDAAELRAYNKCIAVHRQCTQIVLEDNSTSESQDTFLTGTVNFEGYSAPVSVPIHAQVDHYRFKSIFVGFDEAFQAFAARCNSRVELRFAEAYGVASVTGEPLNTVVGDLGFEPIDDQGSSVKVTTNTTSLDPKKCIVHVSRELPQQ